MKIAILTPHPVPLALGGLENLKWGLQSAIERLTEHSCDVVGLISPEGNLWDLIRSYQEASRLDLSAYDCVISGKYPMWMVDHPNHIVYMLHKLRGLYDTYPGDSGSGELRQVPELVDLRTWMGEMTAAGRIHGRTENAVLFERLERLRNAQLPQNLFRFPGALAREIVHFLDAGAISSRQIRRFAVQSMTVKRRADYLPSEVDASVLYPPAHRDDYHCAGDDYLFTSSRLDSPKRLDLLIAAMQQVKADIPLLIAGTGPDEARLKALAAADPRIKFLGFVADEQIPDLYANALAVPFVPYDEDYGLVTIEAMRSSKPVLTFADSGGPTEFVVDGENGYVVPPSPAALAQRIDHLASHRTEARQMGARALERVSSITWETLVTGLLEEAPRLPRSNGRRKLTVATTFPIYPAVGGGQSRVFNLYRQLAQSFDVEVVTLTSGGPEISERHIAPGLKETRIAKSIQHEQLESLYSRALDGHSATDIAAIEMIGLTPAFGEALERSALESEAVIASHPYLVDAIRRAAPGKPLWYEAHNVELTLKQSMLEGVPERDKALAAVRRAELRCWQEAQLVFACADRDLKEFEHLYGPTRARLLEVPNGVEPADFNFVPLVERRRLQQSAGVGHRKTALFMGSWHGPNVEAVELILREAADAPEFRFLVAGSCCLPFAKRTLPANVEMLGVVSNETRSDLLAVADVALNPMLSGSGTNLKMLDYFASGVPVVSTRFGARGLEIIENKHYLAAEPGEFGAALHDVAQRSEQSLSEQVTATRQIVENHYSWAIIAQRFREELAQLGLA
ncbi:MULTISPECIES: glycosyltransferase [unclassified Devosia]|uniref:glycosyltransferase family 4 protein n=1 Tax=unclassified Devosia TaxID=196773 RepID=UPI00155771EE|nr:MULTISPECIES: glycosyltransferase [unclassified Devosia]